MRHPDRLARVHALDEARLLAMYRGLVRTRLVDQALDRLVRTGAIAKAWLGLGEEAATVGPVHALGPRDVVAPMIRNGGACHERGMPVADALRAYLGTADGPSRGRDLHYGDAARGVLPPVSAVGDMVPVAAGVALAFRLRGEPRVALTWVGDGSTKTAAFHEGMNLAAVQRVPLVVVIQNNQVALGTPLARHHAARATDGDSPFAAWPAMYGVRGAVCDGNNVLDAWALAADAVERCRRGEGPALLVAETFRMGGHATHDAAEGRRLLGEDAFARWGTRDPIAGYEAWLVERRGVPRATLADVADQAAAEVARGETEAMESRRARMPRGADALGGVYANG